MGAFDNWPLEKLMKTMMKRLEKLKNCRKFLAQERCSLLRKINLRMVVWWSGRGRLGVVRRKVGQVRARKERLRKELKETVKILKKADEKIKLNELLIQMEKQTREGRSTVEVEKSLKALGIDCEKIQSEVRKDEAVVKVKSLKTLGLGIPKVEKDLASLDASQMFSFEKSLKALNIQGSEAGRQKVFIFFSFVKYFDCCNLFDILQSNKQTKSKTHILNDKLQETLIMFV